MFYNFDTFNDYNDEDIRKNYSYGYPVYFYELIYF